MTATDWPGDVPLGWLVVFDCVGVPVVIEIGPRHGKRKVGTVRTAEVLHDHVDDDAARRYRLELEQPERSDALAHLRELAKDRTLTLLTATKQPEISEAEVLAQMLRD